MHQESGVYARRIGKGSLSCGLDIPIQHAARVNELRCSGCVASELPRTGTTDNIPPVRLWDRENKGGCFAEVFISPLLSYRNLPVFSRGCGTTQIPPNFAQTTPNTTQQTPHKRTALGRRSTSGRMEVPVEKIGISEGKRYSLTSQRWP
jgi:hypothetical protein